MIQQILTCYDFKKAELKEQEFILPEGYRKIQVEYSTVSPGTELFCIGQAVKSDSPVQPGYILCGTDDCGQKFFLFPSLAESSACHCNVKAAGPDSLLLPLPPEIKSGDAGFLRFINIGLHAFNQPAKLPETVCVIGLGPVGNLAAQTAGLLGCRVTGVDPSEKRRRLAVDCGIATVIKPEQLGSRQQSFDLVIDTVAASSTLKSAADILRDGGECSIIGIVKDGELKAAEIFRVMWQRKLVFRSGWEMLNPIKRQSACTSVSTEENLFRALNWLKDGKYTLDPLLTGVIPAEIAAITDVYSKLKDHPDDNICYQIRWK